MRHAHNYFSDKLLGFEEGALTGRLCTFGGERVWVFEYEGAEIDSEHGCGWAQLLSPTALQGEFIDWVGHFVAKREALPEKRRGRARQQKK